MTTLHDRLARDPVTWKPTDEGDTLEGVLLEIEWRESEFRPGEKYPVLTVADEGGTEWIWFASQASARAQIERLQPQPGEQVGARYRGLGEAKPGQSPAKRFRFLVDRQAGASLNGSGPAVDVDIHESQEKLDL